jgi:hypothetical protein
MYIETSSHHHPPAPAERDGRTESTDMSLRRSSRCVGKGLATNIALLAELAEAEADRLGRNASVRVK